jgi:hypothetical protein
MKLSKDGLQSIASALNAGWRARTISLIETQTEFNYCPARAGETISRPGIFFLGSDFSCE